MPKTLSLRQLESYIQELDDFTSPKIELEQYATPPHIAALMLNTINSTFDDLENKLVADLGCGTGRLTLGSIICGASLVIGFDIDRNALGSALANVQAVYCQDSDATNSDDEEIRSDIYKDCQQFNFVQADVVSEKDDAFWAKMNRKFDTVLLNPPFGTKQNPGIDMKFLKRALDLSCCSVYSLHKTSTRDVSLQLEAIFSID